MATEAEGVGFPCNAHDYVAWTILCRYPGANIAQCHHCGKAMPQDEFALIVGQPPLISKCSPECGAAWDAEHPREAATWIPIEETLPGGRYDGIWETSGLILAEQKGDDGADWPI